MYFPLIEGFAWEYQMKSAAGLSRYRFAVVSAAEDGGVLRAHCRRQFEGGPAADVTVTKDARGVFVGKALEFPLPPRLGRAWVRSPNDYRVASLDAVKAVPAGTYRGCLRVVYAIAGGDAGWGERFYAPGVGFIQETCHDEADPFEVSLLSVRPPAGPA